MVQVQEKELPHDLLAERSLLGSLLVDGEAIDEISEYKLSSDDFFHPQYGKIFQGIVDLHGSSQPIDFVTLCGKLSDQGILDAIGGQAFIVEMIEDHASSANIAQYAKIVREKSTVRKVIQMSKRVVDRAMSYQGDYAQFLSEVEASFFNLTSENRKNSLQKLNTFLKMNLIELENDQREAGQLSGLTTGFVELDKKLLGLQPGQLVIVAARPAMGKSAFALNISVNSCKAQGLPVAIFSLEMLSQELSMRMLSGESKIDSGRLRSKNFLDQDLRNLGMAVKELSKLPVFINDNGDTTILDIKSQCRKIKSEFGLGLVVVDYVQLMKSHTNNPSREQQISEISRGLKSLAKELECPIIGLSQLNRAVESRPNKRPMVSDLRESGSIEQDADVVMLIYRDEVYNQDTKHKGIAEIIVGKNRAGETGTVYLSWVGAHTSFGNLTFVPEPNHPPAQPGGGPSH